MPTYTCERCGGKHRGGHRVCRACRAKARRDKAAAVKAARRDTRSLDERLSRVPADK